MIVIHAGMLWTEQTLEAVMEVCEEQGGDLGSARGAVRPWDGRQAGPGDAKSTSEKEGRARQSMSASKSTCHQQRPDGAQSYKEQDNGGPNQVTKEKMGPL